jgi:hypothetical protein
MSAICHSSICVRDNDEFQEKRMALDKEAAKKVLAEIDRNELAQLGCDLTSIPSPTGKEKAITEFILTFRQFITLLGVAANRHERDPW